MVNVPLPAGTKGDVARQVVDEVWLPRLNEFKPQMIFISAGFDAHREDDLGQMGLVEADYTYITERLMEVAKRACERAHRQFAGRRIQPRVLWGAVRRPMSKRLRDCDIRHAPIFSRVGWIANAGRTIRRCRRCPFSNGRQRFSPSLPAVIHGRGANSLRCPGPGCMFAAAAWRRRSRNTALVGVIRWRSCSRTHLPMVEAHFGIPMTGAVLNALNTRLDAASIAFQLNHGEAKVLITDREFAPTIQAALAAVDRKLLIIDVDDPVYDGRGGTDRRARLRSFFSHRAMPITHGIYRPTNGTRSRSTTRRVRPAIRRVSFTRIAALTQRRVAMCWCGQCRTIRFTCGHCRCSTATAGVFHGRLPRWPAPTFVCEKSKHKRSSTQFVSTRSRTIAARPSCIRLLINAPDEMKRGITHKVHAMVAAAAPPASMIEGMDRMGFDLTHVYGLTEVYGPATVCAKQPAWQFRCRRTRDEEQPPGCALHASKNAVAVLDPESMQPVPAGRRDDRRSHVPRQHPDEGLSEKRSGDRRSVSRRLVSYRRSRGVHPDGYLRIKDRSKDIIISGGENISSIEVEDALYRHPAVVAAAVVAQPDPRWGEVPCAFVELKDGALLNETDLLNHCRKHLARFKMPKRVVFGALPKTSTGKIQKFLLRQQVKSAAAIDV